MKTGIAVIGGGSTGASILYHLARKGAAESVLVEREQQLAAGQTSRSSAIIRTHYTVEATARMALRSYEFFRDFENILPGLSAGYTETGLLIGADEESAPPVSDNLGMLRRLGAVTGEVDADEVRAIEPNLDTSAFAAVIFEPHAGYAEPSTTTASFGSAAKGLGARVMLGTRVTKIAKEGGGYALETTRGRLTAEKVVVAAGPWSRPLLAELGIDLPITAVRHPIAIYRRPEVYQGRHPIVVDLARSGYYKPDGRYMLMAGSLEVGLNASGKVQDPDAYDTSIDSDELAKITGWVAEALPIMGSGGRYERGYSGIYDNTPDEQPVIDELSEHGYEDLYVVAGLSGHGFKLSPEFGRILSELVVDGSFRDYDVSGFRLRRFSEGRLLKGRYHVGTIG